MTARRHFVLITTLLVMLTAPSFWVVRHEKRSFAGLAINGRSTRRFRLRSHAVTALLGDIVDAFSVLKGRFTILYCPG
jgi:hypothetical protein